MLTSIRLMLDELEEQAVKMRDRPASVTVYDYVRTNVGFAQDAAADAPARAW
jgi:hypothetical protein